MDRRAALGVRANMLMNVISARVDLKAAAARAERALERYAEPLTALHGGPWPARLLELAWRRVVENSAHDSICGCSHDAVVRQVIGALRGGRADRDGSRAVHAAAHRRARRGRACGRREPVAVRRARTSSSSTSPCRPAGRRSSVRVGDRDTCRPRRSGAPVRSLADLRMAAHEIPEFFRRRRHGRELFGRHDQRDSDRPRRR